MAAKKTAQKTQKQKQQKEQKQKRLVLLDAHAIIHRAYHALPDFASSTGEPTGALYGLSTMLMRIIQDLKPDYIAGCFDLPEPTHRHEVFEAYKGTRAKTDDALVEQLKRSRDVFAAFGIPIYEHPGFEADDCLGTIVHELKKNKDVDIIIASGDMDTLQLVDAKKVRVYTLKKGLSETILYDEEAVQERYGFGPEKIPDYKGLRGDPSDNIPGIKGIGEKGATQIITAFGTIENLYKVIAKDDHALEKAGIKGKAAELIKNGEDEAVFSKMLATIRTDAPISYTLPKKTWHEEARVEPLLALFDSLGFRSLSQRAKAVFGAAPNKGGETEEEKTEDVPEKPEAPVIEPERLARASVATWLLNSDVSAPDVDDILRFAKTDSFEKAEVYVFGKLKETGKLQEVYETIELPLVPIAARIKSVGVLLDLPYLKKLSTEYHKTLDGICARIYAHAGHEFNINSPKQLGDVLFDELKISSGSGKQKKTATGQRSTKEEELIKLSDAHPIIGEILAFRELSKLLSTYVDSLPKLVGADTRLHADFLQAGTTTGRMASLNPNLQNIPIKTEYGRRIRNGFIAAPGCVLIALDYSQVELRIAAVLSGDQKLIDIFREDGDVHQSVAAEVFTVPRDKVDREMRRRAKIINFGIIYGMGVNALRQNLGAGVSREEAATFLNDYFTNFAGLAQYIERTKTQAERQGYTETLFGRRRYFAGFKSSLPYVRAQAERMAINAPIQGTQADIIKLAMIEANRFLKEKGWEEARLVLQVHDELVYEVEEKLAPEFVKELKRIMCSVVTPEQFRGVPLRVDAKQGENWGEMRGV